jgi:hypothetical protein
MPLEARHPDVSRFKWSIAKSHACLLWGPASLALIARLTTGNQIIPAKGAALGSGNNVVYGKVTGTEALGMSAISA